jgi:SOS response regulatory protein OraA/RecX
LLSVRSRSVAEMRRRLLALGYPAGLVDEVIGRLEALRYLDDHEFATSWVASRDRARPRGAGALRQELRQKGIAEATIRSVLEERDARTHTTGAEAGWAAEVTDTHVDRLPGDRADLAAARRLLARKAATLGREPDPRKRRQKAYALLARNGFPPDVCAEAIAGADVGARDAISLDAVGADEEPAGRGW